MALEPPSAAREHSRRQDWRATTTGEVLLKGTIRRAAIAALITSAIATATASGTITRIPAHCRTELAPRLCSIHHHVHRTNHMRIRMGQQRLVYGWRAERHPARRDAILTYWMVTQRRTAARLEAYLEAPWLHGSWYRDAMCVHGLEGSWISISNSVPTYYGGMQYSISTWISAGGLRFAPRADLATPAQQLEVTWDRTRHGADWSEWPNTAAACGLLG